MKMIKLKGKASGQKFVMVSDEDFKFLSQWSWNIIPKGYATRTDRSSGKKKTVYMHREVFSRMGDCPAGLQVDHIDGIKLNNMRRNLRLATNQLNQANVGLQKNNTTGFKGVTMRTKGGARWYIARIGFNGKRISLGYFTDPQIAHEAYVAAAKKYFGEYAQG